MAGDHTIDPKFMAGVDLLRRNGCQQFVVGHTAVEDGEPYLWWAHVVIVHPTLGRGRECAAALEPVTAVMRLCEQLIDGGECMHCKRPTMFEADMPVGTPLDVFADRAMCVFAWDPELAKFRRGCEGKR